MPTKTKAPDRTCSVCHKPYLYGQRLTFEMPSLWPAQHPSEFACSPDCYAEWAAAHGRD